MIDVYMYLMLKLKLKIIEMAYYVELHFARDRV